MKQVVFLAALLIGALSIESQDKKPAKLDRFSWLAGSWEGEDKDGVFEEHWTTPVGGLMIGMGRQTAKQQTLFFEFMKLVEDKEGIAYKTIVGDQHEVTFRLVRLEGDEALFENKKNTLPSRIIYRREKDGSLFARIEGDKDGKVIGEDFKMKRKK